MNPNTPNLAIHPIRIFILDNHNLVRAGLQLLLDNGLGIDVVGEAGQLDEAIDLITNVQPDIILFELNLEDQFTTEIISGLLNACDTARLILVTATTDAKVIQNAVEAGVMGVVFKTQSPEVLIKAIEKVNAGEVWLERSVIANVLTRRSRNQSPIKIDPEKDSIDQLSEREKQVIGLIGQGYKNKKISTQLCISETTVRHHLTSIYRKLGVSDRLELLVFAHRNGLVSTPE